LPDGLERFLVLPQGFIGKPGTVYDLDVNRLGADSGEQQTEHNSDQRCP
jgi:hypothetical protein